MKDDGEELSEFKAETNLNYSGLKSPTQESRPSRIVDHDELPS